MLNMTHDREVARKNTTDGGKKHNPEQPLQRENEV